MDINDLKDQYDEIGEGLDKVKEYL